MGGGIPGLVMGEASRIGISWLHQGAREGREGRFWDVSVDSGPDFCWWGQKGWWRCHEVLIAGKEVRVDSAGGHAETGAFLGGLWKYEGRCASRETQ